MKTYESLWCMSDMCISLWHHHVAIHGRIQTGGCYPNIVNHIWRIMTSHQLMFYNIHVWSCTVTISKVYTDGTLYDVLGYDMYHYSVTPDVHT